MKVSHYSQSHQLKKNRRLLFNKISKIIRLTTKIIKLAEKEGLDKKYLIEKIWIAFHFKDSSYSLADLSTQKYILLSQYFTQRLMQDGNKLAVSALANLYILYKGLNQKLNHKHINRQIQTLKVDNQANLKVQQNQPSFLEHVRVFALSKQIKLEYQDIQQKINTFKQNNMQTQNLQNIHSNNSQHKKLRNKVNNSQSEKHEKKYLIQKLIKYKKFYKDYCKAKEKKIKQQDEQCNRKYGAKVQMQKHNSSQLLQVKRLRQKMLGPGLIESRKQNKIGNQSWKKSSSSFERGHSQQRLKIRNLSN